MTTAARRRRERGQSLIEFAFLMPIVLGMLFTLRDFNMAINSSIVNQRYSRATMQFLFFNHRWYPEEGFIQMSDRGQFMQRWWIGVQDPVSADVTANKAPKAPTIKIGKFKPPSDDDAGSDVQARQNVRIRATTFVCLPPRGFSLDKPFSRGGMPNDAFTAGGKYIGHFCND